MIKQELILGLFFMIGVYFVFFIGCWLGRKQENKSLENIKNIYIGDLLKAKKLLKKLLLALKNENSDYTFALKNTHHVLAEAEQFLSEVEK